MNQLYYYEMESQTHPVILATNGEGMWTITPSCQQHPEKPAPMWKKCLDTCYSLFPYICEMDSAILGLLAKVKKTPHWITQQRDFNVELWSQ